MKEKMKSIKLAFIMFFPIVLTFAFSISTISAQNDSIYIMKSGVIVSQYNVHTEVDSIIFYYPEIVVTPIYGEPFIDERDANEYQTVLIGNKYWMAENLKYLPSVVGTDMSSNDEAYYYVYDYNGTDVEEAKSTENYAIYGVLYNWHAAMNGDNTSQTNPSGVQGICPVGWHLPSTSEWSELTNVVGGKTACKLKEEGCVHWSEPNEGATNERGFTALPGGRFNVDVFETIGDRGNWWSSTGLPNVFAYCRFMSYNNSYVENTLAYKEFGFSVRCVKD